MEEFVSNRASCSAHQRTKATLPTVQLYCSSSAPEQLQAAAVALLQAMSFHNCKLPTVTKSLMPPELKYSSTPEQV
jgi:hypothetical protein